jgi:hypothetical protein
LLTEEQTSDLRWALDSLGSRLQAYRRYRNYYDGLHTLMISSARLKTVFGHLFHDFRLNLCPAVVDSLVDRLQISSFSSGEDEDQDAMDLWKRNRMHRRAGQLHLEAVAAGDAYLLVWPNEREQVTFYPHKSHEVAVDYSKEEPGLIVKAAKWWKDEEGNTRVNLYYPDRVEKYEARRNTVPDPASNAPDHEIDSTTKTHPHSESVLLRAESFDYHRPDGADYRVANEWNQVPVFHFANNADLGEYGVSELRNAVPVQDALNKTVFDMLVLGEFSAYPQRYALNIDVQRDENGQPINPFKSGPERVWAISGGENVQVGQFQAADIEKTLKVKQAWSLDMAQVTQTPPHYFMLPGGLVSGESQKTAEQKLDAKVSDRTTSFGDAWAQAMALAVRMERGRAADGLELDANWKNTKPRDAQTEWAVAETKEALGVSREQILREQGYTEEQIEKFREENAAGGLGQAPTVPGIPNVNLDGILGGR